MSSSTSNSPDHVDPFKSSSETTLTNTTGHESNHAESHCERCQKSQDGSNGSFGSTQIEADAVQNTEKTGPSDSHEPESACPDGGLQAWLVVLGGWCANFCTFGLINCSGVFLEYYVSGPLRQHDASTVSWITSIQVFLMLFLSTGYGRIYDNHGPRWLLWIGTLIYLLGLVAISFCTQYYQFIIAQGIVPSLGACAVFTTSMGSLASWFEKRRSTAFGIMASGGSVGGVVLPILMHRLIESLGFPWMMRVLACMFAALLAVSCGTIKTRVPPKPRQFKIADHFTSLKDIRLSLTAAAMFFFMLGMWMPFNYALLQAKAAGTSPALIPYLLSILNGASIVGRIILGIAADKRGRYNVTIFIAFLCSIACLAVWIPVNDTAGILVFIVILGFSSGAFISLSPTLIAQISNLNEIGTRVGTAYAITSFGAMFGSPIGGAIVAAQNGSYLGLELFCGLAILTSACLFVTARYLLVGFKLSIV